MNMHNVPNSKYCVGIVEAWEEQGYLYICSELCERGNLNDYIMQELVGKQLGKQQKENTKKSSDVTFNTEEDVEEMKDEYSEEIVTPLGNQNISDFEMAPGVEPETPPQFNESFKADSVMFASFDGKPNQLMLKRGNSCLSNMSYQSMAESNHQGNKLNSSFAGVKLLPEKEIWRIF